jgi:YVTN family beta-propeller protein
MRKNIYLFSFIVLLSLAICVHVWAAPFAYIANSGSDSVSVIDTATNTVIGSPISVQGDMVLVTQVVNEVYLKYCYRSHKPGGCP